MQTRVEYLEKKKEYRRANRERILKYYHSNRKFINERKRNADYIRKYGITEVEVLEIWEGQNHKCRICNKLMVIGSKKLDKACVDHDHKTGKIRGILCAGCNINLGRFVDNIGLLKKMISYLEQ